MHERHGWLCICFCSTPFLSSSASADLHLWVPIYCLLRVLFLLSGPCMPWDFMACGARHVVQGMRCKACGARHPRDIARAALCCMLMAQSAGHISEFEIHELHIAAGSEAHEAMKNECSEDRALTSSCCVCCVPSGRCLRRSAYLHVSHSRALTVTVPLF